MFEMKLMYIAAALNKEK